MSRKQEERTEQWRQRIAQQEGSNQTIRAFCREHGINAPSFYTWRQRLREQPVRFALGDTRPIPPPSPGQPIEVVLASGDRLLMAADAATLRLVLNILRQMPA
jgi:transposase-like protein